MATIRPSIWWTVGSPTSRPTRCATLLDLPFELIASIACHVRQYSWMPRMVWNEAEVYLNGGGANQFAYTRHDLSQFLWICSYVWAPVEQKLYWDIHLNLSRWYTMIGQDKFDISDDESDTTLDNSSDRSSNESYSSMPAQEEGQPGSLPLLLNMLDWRPDLGNLVHSVTLVFR